MQTRITSRWLAVAALALTVALTGALPAAAQIERVADPNWTTMRTPDGQPDLQGLWGNKTITPIERPAREQRAYLTEEEMATLNQRRAENEAAGRRSSSGRSTPRPTTWRTRVTTIST